MKISVDTDTAHVTVVDESGERRIPFSDPEAFEFVSKAWLRVGWDAKYVYSFTWMGRPMIQLPEDMIRLQEVIYSIKPDLLIETGVAHGGGLTFYASLFKAMGKGRVIGVDVEIRPHNRKAIEGHELAPLITLIEGDSCSPAIVEKVRALIRPSERVLICLDSNHTNAHVLGELQHYAGMVSKGSYIVVMDGIMADLDGAPRSKPSWKHDNPQEAARDFLETNRDFVLEEPTFKFNEGTVGRRVTYWPNAFLKRIA